MVIVVVLPLTQLLVEQVDIVADAVLVKELVELLVIDAMRPFHLAIEPRRARANVDVPNIESLEVPVELRLKLGTVVRLHHVHAKWQPADDLVDELHGRALVARVVDLQDANPRAIVDGRELIQSASCPRDAFAIRPAPK